MALKTSLRLIARRISQAARNAAALQGLVPGDYALVGSFDERTERISLTLGTDREVDELQLYKDVFREIRSLFPGSPQMAMHIGLVISKVQNLDEIYIDSFPEDEFDMTGMFE